MICAEVESVTPNLNVVVFGLVFFDGIFLLQWTMAPKTDPVAVALQNAIASAKGFHGKAVRMCNEALLLRSTDF